MKKLLLLLAITSSLILTSCGGGGGGGSTSTGGQNYTHSQLADEFVHRLYTDLGIDVTLVKTNTLQYDYIVVYDHDLLTYDAYYIGNYNVGEDLGNYLYNYDSNFYYDLIDLPGSGNVYEDWATGIQFEETGSTGKDLEKIGGLMQNVKNEKAAEKLAAEFGLSEERAMKVAKLASQWESLSKKRSMTTGDADAFSTELLGVNINELKKAHKEAIEGDESYKNELIEQASELNGNSPEAMNDLISNFIK